RRRRVSADDAGGRRFWGWLVRESILHLRHLRHLRISFLLSSQLVAALAGICLSAAPGFAAPPCVWGPFTDVPAAQARLEMWAAAANLPRFDKDKSGIGVD